MGDIGKLEIVVYVFVFVFVWFERKTLPASRRGVLKKQTLICNRKLPSLPPPPPPPPEYGLVSMKLG